MRDHSLTAEFVLDFKHLTTFNPDRVGKIVRFAMARGETILGSPVEEWWEPIVLITDDTSHPWLDLPDGEGGRIPVRGPWDGSAAAHTYCWPPEQYQPAGAGAARAIILNGKGLTGFDKPTTQQVEETLLHELAHHVVNAGRYVDSFLSDLWRADYTLPDPGHGKAWWRVFIELVHGWQASSASSRGWENPDIFVSELLIEYVGWDYDVDEGDELVRLAEEAGR